MRKFKTESKKLLDLMINSIYTNQEIFLRELISNASDAVDKLHFMSLTDKEMNFDKESFKIQISYNPVKRTITVSDNGVGMTKEELNKNLGVIAHSDSLDFKLDNAKEQGEEIDIIGQFGVGFYSVFLVAKKVDVVSRSVISNDETKANLWTSDGVEGYEIKPTQRKERGTDVIVYLKDDDEKNNYSEFLSEEKITELVKKYSNYVRYPIVMEVTKTRQKEKPEDAGEDFVPETEEYKEIETLNSMVSIWKRPASELKDTDYNEFYKATFHDYADPLAHCSIHAEGALTYDALIYIPGAAPFDYYSKDYKKGLQLYNSNVLIMDKCEELVPDYFSFIKGTVDSPDLTLNISRETLQHNSQLLAIQRRIEKKVKSELNKMKNKDREKYEKFFENFGGSIKYGLYTSFGQKKDLLADLLLFYSAQQKKMITLKEYLNKNSKKIKAKDEKDGKDVDVEIVDEESEDQKVIYYAAGTDRDQLANMPAVTSLLKRDMDVLLLTMDVDEFCVQSMMDYEGAMFKNVTSADVDVETEEEKKESEKIADENKSLVEQMKNVLGDEVAKVVISSRVSDAPASLSAEGPISFDMERIIAGSPDSSQNISATKILEVNPKHKVFNTLTKAVKEDDNEKIELYTKLLYDQALLVEGLPLKDAVSFTKNVAKLMK